MMHMSVFKDFPFEITSNGFQFAIQNEPYLIQSYPAISKEFRDMLEKCLDKDPLSRISSEALLDHPCFSLHNISKSEKQTEKFG